MISIIAAIGKNMELGKGNELIWHIPEDMKFFKETTMGHVVIMGKNTYLSLPKILNGRKMVVLSHKEINGVVDVACSLDEILNRYLMIDDEVFIIGGASIYEQFIKYADKLYLTEIDDVCYDADVFFPKFESTMFKKRVLKRGNYNGINYEMCLYDRKN